MQVEAAQVEKLKQAIGSTSSDLKLSLAGDVVHLEGQGLSELDYWEIDPDWDGTIFRSVAQAVRLPRETGVPSSLMLPAGRRGKLVGRFVDSRGNITNL